jgi:GT2 family glycosyltransferase
MTKNAKMIYVIIVNWNNWNLTLACLESVFRSDYSNYRVIVCDNNSHDSSLSFLEAWADGTLNLCVPPDFHLRDYVYPPVPKPLECRRYKKIDAEKGGDIKDKGSRLILVSNGANLGFAGGNNVGLRYALARNDFEYVWLLNNDTVVTPDALSQLAWRMSQSSDAGICGSTLLYYAKPHVVQAYGGGIYNKWFSYSRHIGAGNNSNMSINADSVESRMNYVVGASMFLPRKFLREIGLMEEQYFLYFEDLDWATRAKKRYKLAFAPASIVYHSEGKSTGAGDNPWRKSLMSDYYFIRSRLMFTRKFYPAALPTMYLGLVVTILRRLIRRQYGRVWMIIRLLFDRGRHNACPYIVRDDKLENSDN